MKCALIICFCGNVMETARTYIVRALPWILVFVVAAGCVRYRSFAELSADAEAVPVPDGVTFVRQNQGIHDGPEFTNTKYEQVIRQYSANLPCQFLEDSWAQALRAAGRRFRITNYPHKFGSIGSLEIELNDRLGPVVINLGTDDGHCQSPFVLSINPPH